MKNAIPASGMTEPGEAVFGDGRKKAFLFSVEHYFNGIHRRGVAMGFFLANAVPFSGKESGSSVNRSRLAAKTPIGAPFSNPILSTKYWGSETKTYAFQLRDYGPGIARWLSKDPTMTRGEPNLYGYNFNCIVLGVAPAGTAPPESVDSSIQTEKCVKSIDICCLLKVIGENMTDGPPEDLKPGVNEACSLCSLMIKSGACRAGLIGMIACGGACGICAAALIDAAVDAGKCVELGQRRFVMEPGIVHYKCRKEYNPNIGYYCDCKGPSGQRRQFPCAPFTYCSDYEDQSEIVKRYLDKDCQ